MLRQDVILKKQIPFSERRKKTGLDNKTSAQRAIQSLAGLTLTLLSSYQAACRTSRTTGVCRTVDHSMASIFCGHAEKHIINEALVLFRWCWSRNELKHVIV